MGVLCSSFLLSLLVTPETSLAALDLLASVQRGWLEVSLLAPLFLVAGWSLVGGAGLRVSTLGWGAPMGWGGPTTVPAAQPLADLDLTSATDAEDLAVFAADTLELTFQDLYLLLDVAGAGLVGAGLAWATQRAARAWLAPRRLK